MRIWRIRSDIGRDSASGTLLSKRSMAISPPCDICHYQETIPILPYEMVWEDIRDGISVVSSGFGARNLVYRESFVRKLALQFGHINAIQVVDSVLDEIGKKDRQRVKAAVDSLEIEGDCSVVLAFDVTCGIVREMSQLVHVILCEHRGFSGYELDREGMDFLDYFSRDCSTDEGIGDPILYIQENDVLDKPICRITELPDYTFCRYDVK